MGQRFTTSAGVVQVDAVDVINPAGITDAEAVLAGHPDADTVRKRLAGEETWHTYRVTLSYAGPDPRWALRESADLTVDDIAAIEPETP